MVITKMSTTYFATIAGEPAHSAATVLAHEDKIRAILSRANMGSCDGVTIQTEDGKVVAVYRDESRRPTVSDPLPTPGILRMAANAAKSAAGAVVHAARTGTVSVPKDVEAERLAACTACEKFLHATKQCSICGCYMEIKTRLASASCADDAAPKWTAYTKEDHVSTPE